MSDGSGSSVELGLAVVVRHAGAPGRTRLRLNGAASLVQLSQALDVLSADARVRSVTANARLKSVLVEHDRMLTSEAVAELVHAAISGAAAAPSATAVAAAERSAWHMLPAHAAIEAMASRVHGLTQGEVQARLAALGPNVLGVAKRRRAGEMLLEQFKSLPVGLLLGSAALSLATGGVLEAAVTIAVVALNGGIGYSTESWTERLIARFTATDDPVAPVWRDGAMTNVDARTVTRGDILSLAQGVAVAADARLIESDELAVDESVLTGESYPARKHASSLLDRAAPITARENMVYRGGVVAGGRGTAVVIEIGANTEIGEVQKLLGEARAPQAPMDRELDRLGARLTVACVGAGILVMALLRARGAPWLSVARSGIALAVSAIPEGLPAIAAASKAVAARSLARRGVLVRNLAAIETAGTVTMLCLDKTGTLTQNRMAATVVRSVRSRHRIDPQTCFASPPLGPDSTALARVAILCNDAEVRLDGAVEGSGTETALLALAKTAGFDMASLRAESPRIDAWYRNRDRRYMATEHGGEHGPLLAVKGAPEEVLELCTTALVGGEALALTAALRRRIAKQNEELAAEGLRVLGFAQSRDEQRLSNGSIEGLHWLGLVGLSDPLRPGARSLIASFQRAGVRPIILTGDQASTARSLARDLDLASDGSLDVVDASTLAAMAPEEIVERARTAEVFARVSPADKLKIVQALQANGHVVAMTGDGVNDAPALRAADIGLAMGLSGSQVAKDVADVVIADDGLAGIATFLERGRAAADNIRTAVRFLLGTNVSETLLLALEAMRGANELESPMELLWLNLVTDVFPALGLALAPPAGDALSRGPRDPRHPLFDKGEAAALGGDALSLALPAMAAHVLAMARYGSGPQARGLTFLTLAGAQLVHTLTLAPRNEASAADDLAGRWGVKAGVAASAALLAAPFLFTPLGRLLGVARPTLGALMVAMALSATPLARASGASLLRKVARARRG